MRLHLSGYCCDAVFCFEIVARWANRVSSRLWRSIWNCVCRSRGKWMLDLFVIQLSPSIWSAATDRCFWCGECEPSECMASYVVLQLVCTPQNFAIFPSSFHVYCSFMYFIPRLNIAISCEDKAARKKATTHWSCALKGHSREKEGNNGLILCLAWTKLQEERRWPTDFVPSKDKTARRKGMTYWFYALKGHNREKEGNNSLFLCLARTKPQEGKE